MFLSIAFKFSICHTSHCLHTLFVDSYVIMFNTINDEFRCTLLVRLLLKWHFSVFGYKIAYNTSLFGFKYIVTAGRGTGGLGDVGVRRARSLRGPGTFTLMLLM